MKRQLMRMYVVHILISKIMQRYRGSTRVLYRTCSSSSLSCRRRYHVLLIIAYGRVIKGSETELGQLSLQEQETVDARIKARCSEYPLSINLVGVVTDTGK
ncbi:hypothetical protein C5167_018111 [Papaver somniferum]|uniref:Copine C-terminal domain-containing protein n=1 Tax=Papaver somniferum TaxID=3469 RepID=A0A4Y7IQA4_PAPSO|nr:hypothetical protein C5167_018111 [Papaver somniferum]